MLTSEKGDACRAENSWREMFGFSAEGFLYRIHHDHSLHLLGRDRKLTWHFGGLASLSFDQDAAFWLQIRASTPEVQHNHKPGPPLSFYTSIVNPGYSDLLSPGIFIFTFNRT